MIFGKNLCRDGIKPMKGRIIRHIFLFFICIFGKPFIGEWGAQEGKVESHSS